MSIGFDQDVNLRISAETKGGDQVKSLAQQISELGQGAGVAAPQFEALGAKVAELEQRQGAVQQFKELKLQVSSLGTQMAQAQGRVDDLSAALEQARSAAADAGQAQAQSATALEAARARYSDLRLSVSGARNELTFMRQRMRESGETSDLWSQQIEANKVRLAAMKQELGVARAEVQLLAKEQKESARAVKEAEAAQKSANAQYEQSITRARDLSASLGNHTRSLDQARAALKAAGISTSDLTQENARLSRALADAATEARTMGQQLQNQDASALRVAAALDHMGTATERATAAMGRIGIRSSAQIQTEINQINQDLVRLATNSAVTTADFDRAFAQAQLSVAKLEAEMRGMSQSSATNLEKVGGAAKKLMAMVAPMGGMLAGVFAVDQISRYVVEFDRVNRAMIAITGSSSAAAKELAYISSTANRLGLDMGSVAKSYSSFMAATRGTSLEGQKTREVFESVANAMAKLGRSSEDTEGALLAMQQMVSKGSVQMEELRMQLGDRIPGAMQAAADGAGVTQAQLIKMVESGQVLAEDLLPAMAAQLNKLYGGKGQIEGYAASWGRFKTAMMTSVGSLGQSVVVMKTVNGVLEGISVTIRLATLGANLFSIGLEVSAKRLGVLAAAIRTLDFSHVREEFRRIGQDGSKELREAAKSLGFLGEKAKEAGDQSLEAANKAMAANGGWLKVAATYSELEKNANQATLAGEKFVTAMEAQKSAVLAFAQAGGNEREIRETEAAMATKVSKAHQILATDRKLELKVMEEHLAKAQEVVAASGQESDAKKKLIETLQQKIEITRQEAARDQALADQSRAQAVQSKIAADAMRDHSAEIQKWKDAVAVAANAQLAATKNLKEGTGSQEQATRATERHAYAEGMLKDALADAAANIDAKNHKTQEQFTVEQQLLRLQQVQAGTVAQFGKLYGDETLAVWANVEAKQAEAKIANLRAQAQAAEAEAMLRKIEVERQEAEINGTLTPAKVAELEAAKASAQAKAIEGKISQELAHQLEQEASAAIRAAGAKDTDAKSGKALADSAQNAGGAVTQMAAGMNDAGSVAKWMADTVNKAAGAVGQVSGAAEQSIHSILQSSKSLEEFTNQVGGLAGKAKDFASGSGQIKQELEGVRHQAESARAMMDYYQSFFSDMGPAWQKFGQSVITIYQVQEAIARAKEKQLEFTQSVQNFNEQVAGGQLTLAQQSMTLSQMVETAKGLGSQELGGLRSALSSVDQQLKSIADSARSTLSGISDELDQLNGRYVEIQTRQYQAKRMELQTQMDAARKSGNSRAVSDLQQAMADLEAVNGIKTAQAQAQESEYRQKQAASGGNGNLNTGPQGVIPSTPPAPQAGPERAPQIQERRVTEIHRIEINVGGKKTAINVAGREDADALEQVFSRLEAAARTSS